MMPRRSGWAFLEAGSTALVLSLPMIVAMPMMHACSAPKPSSGFPELAKGGLKSFDFAPDDSQEHITVFGMRPRFTAAPSANYGDARAPWEIGTAIHDTMTGADTRPFGNAYNLGSPMGSDERSNETGGSFVAPRHD